MNASQLLFKGQFPTISGFCSTSKVTCSSLNAIPLVHKQNGGLDCSLYAIAYATYFTHGKNPNNLSDIQFD